MDAKSPEEGISIISVSETIHTKNRIDSVVCPTESIIDKVVNVPTTVELFHPNWQTRNQSYMTVFWDNPSSDRFERIH